MKIILYGFSVRFNLLLVSTTIPLRNSLLLNTRLVCTKCLRLLLRSCNSGTGGLCQPKDVAAILHLFHDAVNVVDKHVSLSDAAFIRKHDYIEEC